MALMVVKRDMKLKHMPQCRHDTYEGLVKEKALGDDGSTTQLCTTAYIQCIYDALTIIFNLVISLYVVECNWVVVC